MVAMTAYFAKGPLGDAWDGITCRIPFTWPDCGHNICLLCINANANAGRVCVVCMAEAAEEDATVAEIMAIEDRDIRAASMAEYNGLREPRGRTRPRLP